MRMSSKWWLMTRLVENVKDSHDRSQEGPTESRLEKSHKKTDKHLEENKVVAHDRCIALKTTKKHDKKKQIYEQTKTVTKPGIGKAE